jgi:hypothetical protein
MGRNRRSLPDDLRSELLLFIARAKERGFDRADIITAIKHPSKPPSRDRGRPRKDSDAVLRQVSRKMFEPGESFFSATKAVARDIPSEDTLPDSIARRLRAAFIRRLHYGFAQAHEIQIRISAVGWPRPPGGK